VRRFIILMGVMLAAASCSGTSVGEMKAGDCFNDPDEETVTNLVLIDCAQPHDNEVYAEVQMDETTYPGSAAIQDFAVDACLGAFEPYVGQSPEESQLDYFFMNPSEEGWGEGDHSVLCVLYSPDLEQLTGSQASG
jgi:hypothetical protein